MPSFTRDDDDDAGCSRGMWGPNFCECPACSHERLNADKKRREYNQPLLDAGLDPEESGNAVLMFIADSDMPRLERLAMRKNLDIMSYVSWLIKRHLDGDE